MSAYIHAIWGYVRGYGGGPLGDIPPMAQSESRFRGAKPAAKPYKVSDEGGLFLLVSPGGGRLWRLKYRYLGKEQLLSFGNYPEVSLKDARQRRDEAKAMLAKGIDPGAEKKRNAVAARV
ncbi:MAG: Arm DNA-binding domain-containing protein, partial [Asticcacaulis sp.]